MVDFTQANRAGKLYTVLGDDMLLLRRLTCTSRLGEPFVVVVDAVSSAPRPVHSLLGTNAHVEFENEGEFVDRCFNGDVWEYVELGFDGEGFHYRLTLRPTVAFQSLNLNSRIFQHKSVPEIAKMVLIGNVEQNLRYSYGEEEYCVQYQESDFAFVSRLLEREGIYYYFRHTKDKHTLALVDTSGGHQPGPVKEADVQPRSDSVQAYGFWTVSERRSVALLRATMDDYDFEAPKKKLEVSQPAADPLGKSSIRQQEGGTGSSGAWGETSELYQYPAGFTVKDRGDTYAKVRLDAHRRQMARSFANGSVFSASVGDTIKLIYRNELSRGSRITIDYLIVGATHRYSGPTYVSRGSNQDDDAEDFAVELELMPADEQYRPSQRTPQPRVFGPHTAIVTGPSGEEIYTDKYGRIKVQFHWDREGKDDENSSCFVRVAHASAGKTWGAFTIPRIGQEVIIEFLDGDPDKPICTGAVYNAENMPPEELPAKMTQSGFKSRSTKQSTDYNRWWFEDKKGSEVVWVRAQKDYDVHVVNGNETRNIDSGNRTTTISTGNDTYTLKKGNRSEAIETGNDDLTLKMGNRSAALDMGNDSLTLKMGNRTTKLDIGSDMVEAMQSIELKVGQSSIKIDQMGVTIKGMIIKLDAELTVNTKGSAIAQHEGDGMKTLKGGIVMIN